MKPKIKVLVINAFNSKTSHHSDAEMLMKLQEDGVCDIEVMAFPGSPFSEDFKKAGIKVIAHHPTKKIQPESIRKIRQRLKEGGHQVLHVFNSKSIPNGIIAAWSLPVKVVAYRGAIGPYWYDPTSYLAHLNPRVDAVVCLSDYVRRSLASQHAIDQRKLHTIHKGFNLRHFEEASAADLREELGIKTESPFFVVSVGNLRPVKGIKYLMEAAEILSSYENIHFVLIGNGTDAASLRQEINRLPNAGRIHALGFQPHALSYILAADVYVQPSLSEGLCRAVVEAMALERCVVSTKSGGPQELIQHGHNGLLVPVKHGEAIAEAIAAIYRTPEKGREMGRNARISLQENFNIEKTAEKTAALYHSLLS